MFSLDFVAIASGVLGLYPLVQGVRNLSAYKRAPAATDRSPPACAVLIPARNEAGNIEAAVRSVLSNVNARMEILVGDDASTDATAEIVERLAAEDERIKLVRITALPPGWCGKQHACHLLAREAVAPVLLFMDADVRLSRNAVQRIWSFLEQSGADLVSGVPMQETESISERLLVPLIHFLLLGFLPMRQMRRSLSPSFSAGCGQLFMVRAESYRASGGHARIRDSLHDGLRLPRSLRAMGFRTDLFDATDLGRCRMFQGGNAWAGFLRNAHEGLGSSQLIAPGTLFLAGGQILPFVLLALARSPIALLIAGVLAASALMFRFLLAIRFKQSLASAVLHPLGITILVFMQWVGFIRALLGRPAIWRERVYQPATAS